MAFRLFLDTEILLDFALKRRSYPVIRQLMKWAVGGRIQIFITTAAVRDLGLSLSAAYGTEKAKELLLALLAEIQLIDTGFETTVNALHSKMEDIPSALSYYSALHHRLDYFISRDKELAMAANPMLPVCTPEEFVSQNRVEGPRQQVN